MIRIVALDLSTKRTGVTLPTGRTLSWTPPAEVGARLHWLAGGIGTLLTRQEPALIVVEGLPVHTYPKALAAGAQLHGVVRLVAYEHSVPVVDVDPNRLKRWATGRGNADKDDMLAAARYAGAEVDNHDEADAWLLWCLAGSAYDGPGLPGDDAGHRLEVLSKITWPVIR